MSRASITHWLTVIQTGQILGQTQAFREDPAEKIQGQGLVWEKEIEPGGAFPEKKECLKKKRLIPFS